MGTFVFSARASQVVGNQAVLSNVLVGVMPSMDKQRLTNRLIGAINAAFPRLNARAYQALRALLSHAGFHSNRVWSSLRRLGRLIVGPSDTSVDQGYKLAERGIADLVKAKLVRVITDEKELLSGPGEHEYLAKGGEKQGDGAVNHYDLSALLEFIDEQDKADWARLLNQREYNRPGPTAPPDDLADVSPSAAPEPAPDDDPFEEGFEERENTRLAILTSLSMASAHHMAPCNVEVAINNSGTEHADGAQPTRCGSEFFVMTEVSPITQRAQVHTHTRGEGETKRQQAISSDDRGTVFGLLTRSRPNGGFGLDKPGAQRLVADHSEQILRDVLEYIRALEEQGGELYGPGRVTKTVQAIAAGSGYPNWYIEVRDKAKRQAERDRRRAEREAARAVKEGQDTLDGVVEPLRGIWDKLKAGLRELPSIRESLWQMHIRPLCVARLDGDVVIIEAVSKAGYEVLSLRHEQVFTEALRLLLKQDTLTVRFVWPQSQKTPS